MKETKKLLQKHELRTKGKVHIINFSDKGNNDVLGSGSKGRSFSTQEVGRSFFP